MIGILNQKLKTKVVIYYYYNLIFRKHFFKKKFIHPFQFLDIFETLSSDENKFLEIKSCEFVRKYTFSNRSRSNVICRIKFTFPENKPVKNMRKVFSHVYSYVKSQDEKYTMIVIQKINPEEPWDDYKVECKYCEFYDDSNTRYHGEIFYAESINMFKK